MRLVVGVEPVDEFGHQVRYGAGIGRGIGGHARIARVGHEDRTATPLPGRFAAGVPVTLEHPVQRVEQTLAVTEIRYVVQGLEVGHHALVGERLLAVLLGNVHVALAGDQVFDVDRGDPESFDRVRCRHRVSGEISAHAGAQLGVGIGDLLAQGDPRRFDFGENTQVCVAQCGSWIQHVTIRS
jgi:hypothetical protein